MDSKGNGILGNQINKKCYKNVKLTLTKKEKNNFTSLLFKRHDEIIKDDQDGT